VSGFHELHCLVSASPIAIQTDRWADSLQHVVRDTIYYLNGTIDWPSPPFLWSHVLHCIEAVRQSVNCNLDPTLIPLDTVWPGIPNGQVHECRNFDPLFDFALRHRSDFPDYNAILEGPHSKEWIDRKALLDGESLEQAV
jgi:hypothetical protein